jgi:hypothetical protein
MNNDIVYVVRGLDVHNDTIEGIFRDEEEAEDYMALLDENHDGGVLGNYIEEHELR